MLEEYQAKRDFQKTAEPAAEPGKRTGALRFVIQKHAARRLHYDLRLELDGVLLSWAVPKGPSLNPDDKRLAVQTEDHPIEYQSFEGNIPKGEYGAGSMIIWDAGTYHPDWNHVRNPGNKDEEAYLRKGIKEGKITFVLQGKKVSGSWTLFRLNSSAKDWLLRKNHDEFVSESRDLTEEDASVVSGRTIEEVREGKPPAKGLIDLNSLEGARNARLPKTYTPMLTTLVKKPFDKEGWIYEPKMDGIRAIARIDGEDVQLFSRNGLNLSAQYPSVLRDLAGNGSKKLLLDGEIVALDANGRPSFQLLQQRSGLSRLEDVTRADQRISVVYYVFDIVHANGKNLENVPLRIRKQVLQEMVTVTENVRLITAFDEGVMSFQACIQNGLEGIVAKSLDSIYEPGKRTKAWLKVKGVQTGEFLICGYTEGSGARSDTFGSMLLGYHAPGGELRYAGGVGTGFDSKMLHQLKKTMDKLKRKTSPYARPPRQKGIQWIKPELVAEVKYAEVTKDGLLRVPVFMRLRDDISPQDVGVPTSQAG